MSSVTPEEASSFFAEHLPFFEAFGFSVESVEDGVGVARFVYDDKWTRPYQIINGGTLMALADVAVYLAIFGRLGIIPLAVTNELKMNFLRPAKGEDVLARAHLLKVGRRVAYGDAVLFHESDQDRLLAHATSSYILPGD